MARLRATGWAFAFVACTALPDTSPAQDEPITTSRHAVTVGGTLLRYTTRAGRIAIRENETGDAHGQMFFVSYTLDRPSGERPRPLTFVWNGGPGSNSALVHLIGFGPKRIVPKAGSKPNDGGRWIIEPNPGTWLNETDLVFVDPIGTGFSRPARAEYPADFYGVLGDVATVEFIRTYRTRFDAWDAPVYLAGESYGVWRAAGAAEAMEEAEQRVAGVILISGGIPLGPVVPDEMKTAMFNPTRTASAFYHRKLSADLQRDRQQALAESEKWARSVYGPALGRVDNLTSAERTEILTQLSRFTGLDTSRIDHKTLVVDRQFLIDNLLKDRGQGSLGRFDTRQIGGGPRPSRVQEASRRALINRYLRNDLGFKTDLVYQGLETGYSSTPNPEGVNARWQYDQGDPNAPLVVTNTDGPPGGTPPWLERAMDIDPSIRAFVATGILDSLNSCPGNAYALSQLPRDRAARITFKCYEGGHMMYEDRDARFALKRDIARFYAGAAQ
jgi:carboxypeptidase C (cathepsin A)